LEGEHRGEAAPCVDTTALVHATTSFRKEATLRTYLLRVLHAHGALRWVADTEVPEICPVHANLQRGRSPHNCQRAKRATPHPSMRRGAHATAFNWFSTPLGKQPAALICSCTHPMDDERRLLDLDCNQTRDARAMSADLALGCRLQSAPNSDQTCQWSRTLWGRASPINALA
jgi:hypothetical protein